jgi:hypothetical protein
MTVANCGVEYHINGCCGMELLVIYISKPRNACCYDTKATNIEIKQRLRTQRDTPYSIQMSILHKNITHETFVQIGKPEVEGPK